MLQAFRLKTFITRLQLWRFPVNAKSLRTSFLMRSYTGRFVWWINMIRLTRTCKLRNRDNFLHQKIEWVLYPFRFVWRDFKNRIRTRQILSCKSFRVRPHLQNTSGGCFWPEERYWCLCMFPVDVQLPSRHTCLKSIIKIIDHYTELVQS